MKRAKCCETQGLSLEGGRGYSGRFSTRYPISSDSTSQELPQWPITHALGVEPTENELVGALRSMANAKAVGPDELPAELLKLGINYDPTVLQDFRRVIKPV